MSKVRGVAGRLLDVDQPAATRFGHVVSHLYVARERWDLAIPDLPRDPRRRASSWACEPSEVEPRASYHSACEECKGHVLEDHDDWYLPAALSAVETGVQAGHVGEVSTRQGPRELFVGANAVQVLTRIPDRRGVHAFATAYRDPPTSRNPSNAEFHAKAVRKLRDKTSLGSGDPS